MVTVELYSRAFYLASAVLYTSTRRNLVLSGHTGSQRPGGAVNSDHMTYNAKSCTYNGGSDITMRVNKLLRTFLISCLPVLVLPLYPVVSLAQDAMALFNQYNNRIYQIRIIEQASGKQAALGSGFQINGDGTMVTNFHVVSEYTNHPARYRVEFVASDGKKGVLQLIDIDVINDLALVKKEDIPGPYLDLAPGLPLQGEAIYSLGNPHDLGLTVVPGTYNGMAAHSLYERIHFSGSINPGMSGGPVLNTAGQVIGVNVSTAGNQISFLVPLDRLSALIHRPRSGPVSLDTIKQVMTGQLLQNQQQVIGDLISKDWQTAPFKQANIPNEIAGYIRCWGMAENDPELSYENFMSVCSQEENIFLTGEFTTGTIVYQFNWLESDELNIMQFYNVYQTQIENVYPDNNASKEDTSSFECNEDFHQKEAIGKNREIITKGTFCTRKYLQYPGLYDVLYLGATVHENRQGLVSHFTLAGVSMEMAQQFTRKFLASITWN